MKSTHYVMSAINSITKGYKQVAKRGGKLAQADSCLDGREIKKVVLSLCHKQSLGEFSLKKLDWR